MSETHPSYSRLGKVENATYVPQQPSKCSCTTALPGLASQLHRRSRQARPLIDSGPYHSYNDAHEALNSFGYLVDMSSVREQVDIAATIAFLRRSDSYPDFTESVEVVETHRSWIFLLDQYAYKLKKPVRTEYFDFSTLEARRQNCHHEVRLNRRLAESVYLGVVSVTLDAGARLTIEGNGEPVEWLIKMRKLNRTRMLDHCIINSTVKSAEIESVGRLLGSFYCKAVPTSWSEVRYLRQLTGSISSARGGLLKLAFGLPRPQIDDIARRLLNFTADHRAELTQRVRAGRVIDAHGDLRPEHICLESPPVIIDCLEFSQDLRVLDAASEMSFLIQECEILGAAEIGRQLWQHYYKRTSDGASHPLRSFYCGYHALLRASLAIAHLGEPGVRHPEAWKAKAQRYLDIASSVVP